MNAPDDSNAGQGRQAEVDAILYKYRNVFEEARSGFDNFIADEYVQKARQALLDLLKRAELDARKEQATSDLQVVFDIYSNTISPDFAFELMKERVTRLTNGKL